MTLWRQQHAASGVAGTGKRAMVRQSPHWQSAVLSAAQIRHVVCWVIWAQVTGVESAAICGAKMQTAHLSIHVPARCADTDDHVANAGRMPVPADLAGL